MGVLTIILREKRLVIFTVFGNTSEYAGTNKTSSNVSPSKITLFDANDMIFFVKFMMHENTKNYLSSKFNYI
jgi:hypothetical protein